MTSGIDELEALLAALRLSFLTSSSATSSPEALRQSIAVFRAALRPQGIVVASPSQTVAHMQKPDDGNHHDFVTAGEPTSAASTTCGDDDRIDMVSQLSKRMDLVTAELRQGNDHIRELVQSVEELKKEVRDLRSAVVAPKSLASTEDHPPPSSPVIDAVKKCAILAPVNQAQVEPSPSPYAVGGSRPTPSIPTYPQPTPEVTASSSIPSPIIPACSFIPPKLPSPRLAPQLVSSETPMTLARSPHATEATVPPTLPHLRSWPPSLAPCPVAIPTPAQTLNTVPTSAPNDEGKMKAEDAMGLEDFVTAESRPKSPVIATAVRHFITGQEGDLKFDEGAKITILDHVTTQAPEGWMYGETTETRRGIFPARYVLEVSHLDIKDELNNDHISDNSEIKPGSKTPIIVKAVDSYYLNPWDRNELRVVLGDMIQVLDSPDTPVGWMYGEIAETRRGIFPARFVKLEE